MKPFLQDLNLRRSGEKVFIKTILLSRPNLIDEDQNGHAQLAVNSID